MTRNIIPCLLIASALVACSRSESSDAATDDTSGVGPAAEGTPAAGVKPSERVTAGDGTVRVKAGNTDVVVDKDSVKTGGVIVDKDGVKTGGTAVDKDGVKAGGVTVKKDGTISVPGVP